MFGSEDFRLKMRHLLWPFVRLWLLFHGGLALACVVLVCGAAPVQEREGDFWGLWLPLLVGTLVVAPGLGGRLRLIRDEGGSGYRRVSMRDLLLFTAILTFATAVGTLPYYLAARLASVCRLPDLGALSGYPPARYYLAATARLDSSARRTLAGAYASGGRSSRNIFYLALACPVAPSHATPGMVPAWVGFYYDYHPPTRASSAPTLRQADFLARSRCAFARDVARPCTYFERWSDDRAGTAVRASLGEPAATDEEPPLVLQPHYTPFTERGADILALWVTSQVIGSGLFGLLLLALPVSKVQKRRLLASSSST